MGKQKHNRRKSDEHKFFKGLVFAALLAVGIIILNNHFYAQPPAPTNQCK